MGGYTCCVKTEREGNKKKEEREQEEEAKVLFRVSIVFWLQLGDSESREALLGSCYRDDLLQMREECDTSSVLDSQRDLEEDPGNPREVLLQHLVRLSVPQLRIQKILLGLENR